MSENEIKELFAAAVRHPEVDRIDLDAVLRGGRRRQRARTAVTVGSVVAVPAIVAVVAVVTALSIPTRGGTTSVTAGPPPSPVTSAAQLAGRWAAVSINGRPVTATPPATVIFGASGLADSWQLHTGCAPEPSGRVIAQPDGRFTAVAAVGGDVDCPALLPGAPDLLNVLTNARYARTRPARSSSPAELTLLDPHRNVIAELRADALATCDSDILAVTFDGTTLRATNTGQPCRLSGKYAVEVPWWALDGPDPVAPRGILLTGDTLVQAYTLGPGNTCPFGGADPHVADLGVRVEGQVYRVTVPGRQAREVTSCDSATAAPPTIEP